MELEGFPIKKTGSQGQQKTFLVALKLAKYDFIKETTNKNPIFLLDDIFDKFDKKRVKQIIKIVSDNNFGQIFITDTNEKRLSELLLEFSVEYNIFNIEKNGIINHIS